jgi:hypothetical protein
MQFRNQSGFHTSYQTPSQPSRLAAVEPAPSEYTRKEIQALAKEWTLTAEELDQKALRLLGDHWEHLDFETEKVDIIGLATEALRDKGFTIHHAPDYPARFGKPAEGGRTNFYTREIWINTSERIHPYTQRTALAHEVLHALDHTEFYEQYLPPEGMEIHAFEMNAKNFARMLLLPSTTFPRWFEVYCKEAEIADPLTATASQLSLVVSWLSRHFEVSTGAVCKQLKELLLIGSKERAEMILFESGIYRRDL